MTTLIAVFSVGVIMGFVLARIVGAQGRADRATEALEEYIAAVKSFLIVGYVEEHDGKLHMYELETDKFLASGHDDESLQAAAAERFPGKAFCMVERED